MDIPRPENKKRKRIRQIVIGSATAVALAIVTIALSRLEPAAPSVDADTLYTGKVERGEMLRQTRGPGTLVPRTRLWIAAQSAGRVERVVVRPGAVVEPDSILVELTNPDLLRQAEEKRYGLEFAKANFAEFELGMHEMAERGDAITGDSLNELYLGLVRKYYGHDKGICTVDDLYGAEWTYVHHFYYNFYVYQYATSLIASTALANNVRGEGGKSTKKRDAYLNLLSSGSSKYPVDLLKDAGVDMTTPAPFKACMKEMNAVMGDMEKILARRDKLRKSQRRG